MSGEVIDPPVCNYCFGWDGSEKAVSVHTVSGLPGTFTYACAACRAALGLLSLGVGDD